MKTFKNKFGKPIIRRCANCLNFKEINGKSSNGYCRLKPMLFAFTHEATVFPIVKDFYLCENHKFLNEEILSKTSEEVDLYEYLQERKDSEGLKFKENNF